MKNIHLQQVLWKQLSYLLVIEEFNSTKVVLDPFSEDGVFLSSVGQFTVHAPADIRIESEEEWVYCSEYCK